MIGFRSKCFPEGVPLPESANYVIKVFSEEETNIQEALKLCGRTKSDVVLDVVSDRLLQKGFKVETSKKPNDKVPKKVKRGKSSKTLEFDVDAFYESDGVVVEIEGGGATENNRFLKDLFEACVMPSANYLVIAVCNKVRKHYDYDKVVAYFEALYNGSDRFQIPLKAVVVIGYPGLFE